MKLFILNLWHKFFPNQKLIQSELLRKAFEEELKTKPEEPKKETLGISIKGTLAEKKTICTETICDWQEVASATETDTWTVKTTKNWVCFACDKKRQTKSTVNTLAPNKVIDNKNIY